MKNSPAYLSLLVPALVLACWLPVAEVSGIENLLLNPGFEEVEADGPSDWLLLTDPAHVSRAEGVATVAVLRQDTGQAKEGSASALLLHEGPRWATLRQKVKVRNGETYRLAVFVRTSKSATGNVRLAMRLSGRKGEDNISAHDDAKPVEIKTVGDWKEVTREFSISGNGGGEEEVWFELRVILGKPPEEPVPVWFDGVSLVRVESGG